MDSSAGAAGRVGIRLSSPARTAAEDLRVATHEAAHAVCHYLLRGGSGLRVVTIEPSERWAGVMLADRTQTLSVDADDLLCPLPLMPAKLRRELEIDVVVDLAGQIAEDAFAFESRYGLTEAEERAEQKVARLTLREERRLAAAHARPHSTSDEELARRRAWMLAGESLQVQQLALLRAVARELVAQPSFRRLVQALVPQLLERRTLGGRSVVQILKAAANGAG